MKYQLRKDKTTGMLSVRNTSTKNDTGIPRIRLVVEAPDEPGWSFYADNIQDVVFMVTAGMSDNEREKAIALLAIDGEYSTSGGFHYTIEKT